MSEPRQRVRVDNGKYEFVNRNGYTLDVMRHGEGWAVDVEPSKAIIAMMAELDAARVVLAAVRISASLDSAGTSSGVRAALEIHDGLVYDHEPPSAWAIPEEDHPLRSHGR